MNNSTTIPKVKLTSVLIPFFQSSVAAGFPSPAEDYVECTLDLNELCIRNPPATFFVRAEGESMIDVGIDSGDLLVVDRSIEASHGDIVIAAVNGEFTVKIWHIRNTYQLVPANANFSPIDIKNVQDFLIFGVVTYVIKQMHK